MLAVLPIAKAQDSTVGSSKIRISSYQNDPFVETSQIDRIDGSGLKRNENGRLLLSNAWINIADEPLIYRQDAETGLFNPFATNPWPQPTSNEKDNFKFPDEERFPLHEIERGPDGKPLLDENGRQQWKPRDLHLGMTTTFKAASEAREAAEWWSGRRIDWGASDSILEINSHAFIDFNAFFSPTAQGLFFGVVPYRLPGRTEVRILEMASSWEVAAHESGHALQGVLKPNRDWTDPGYQTWGESFGDQMEMWASLRDRPRVRSVLAETGGDLNRSSALTQLAEALGPLTGEDTCLRDAFHDRKVSDTTTEPHDRSEVLTGAAYNFFVMLYESFRSNQGLGEPEAVEAAADVAGTFITRTVDYTPENTMTLEDVVRAYLKVDKELFGSRYHQFLLEEFTRRELFDSNSLNDWLAHEAALPNIKLPGRSSDKAINKMLQQHLDELGIGPEFGVMLQSVTRDSRFGQTLVRVQLTEGRDDSAVPLENHGLLVFRSNGTLADYYSPIPGDYTANSGFHAQAEARSLVARARVLGLAHRGAPLSIALRPDGRQTVEARVMRSKGFYCWEDVYSLENPGGERRNAITPQLPRRITGYQGNGVEILTADDLARR